MVSTNDHVEDNYMKWCIFIFVFYENILLEKLANRCKVALRCFVYAVF